MKKLKELLKESYVWERKFGEKLPTLASIQEKKKLKEVGASADYRKYTKNIEKTYRKYLDQVGIGNGFRNRLHEENNRGVLPI